MNSEIQQFLQVHLSCNDLTSTELKQLLNDLDHIKSLTKIRGQDKEYSRYCFNCKIKHDIDTAHNFVMQSYSEAEFISDLISEYDTLYQITNWAHNSIGQQYIRDQMPSQDKAWNHILQKNYDQVNNYLSDDEKCILNSLKPYGESDKLFDFMQLSKYQNENWVLTLEQLFIAIQRPPYDSNKLYNWVTCQSVIWQETVTKFNEDLWLNLRAELFYKVMTRHNELFPKMERAINFGINKPFIIAPKFYELNQGQINDKNQIIWFGKKFIIEIIKFLNQSNHQLQFCVEDALAVIKSDSIKQSPLRVRTYYEIGLMLADLLNLEKHPKWIFDLIALIISLLEQEFIDRNIKLKYIIHLLSILRGSQYHLDFIVEVCQRILNSQGDSLAQFLQKLLDYGFDKDFITKVVFEQFVKLSPHQQNELLSENFKIYFNNLDQYILSLLPYIVENIDHFYNQFEYLKFEYGLQNEDNYYQVYVEKDIERMLEYLKSLDIPNYWFTRYIQFILNQEDVDQAQILGIMEGIQINDQLFQRLENRRELLALLAKKLTQIKNFVNYLVK